MTDPGIRLRALLAAAWGDSDQVRASWRRWRTLLPDLDDIHGAEIAVVPVAWHRVRSVGIHDADEGRLRGLQRRASVQAADRLAACVAIQADLRDRGIPTLVGGRVAAALAYPAGARWPTVTAELLIDPADVGAALAGRRPPTRDRLRGRTPAQPGTPHIMLRWRQPDRRSPIAAGGSRTAQWQGRTLESALPHEVAYQCLLRGLLPVAPGDPGQAQALLDLHLLTADPLFDDGAFARAVNTSGWCAAIAVHARAWVDVLPPQLTALLTGDPRGIDLRDGTGIAPWGNLQARATATAVRAHARLSR